MARDPAFNTITRLPSELAGKLPVSPPYDALSNPTNDDLITAALTEWPPGAAWGTPDGQALPLTSWLARFTRVMLDGFVFLYARAFKLTREATVSGVDELLPEWESDHGLPDPCFVGQGSTAERLRALEYKVLGMPAITPGDFIRVAADYGFEIEIEEPCVFECGFSELASQHTTGDVRQETYWIVRARNAAVSYFEIGASELGVDPLFSLGESEQLICMLRGLAPAWTLPVLHPWINLAHLVTEDGTPIIDEYGNRLLVVINP